MFFASRWQVPPVSQAFAEVADLFARGQAHAAGQLLVGERPVPASANDFLLSADVAAAAGASRRAAALIRLGQRRFPDAKLVLTRALDDLSHGRFGRAQQALLPLLESLSAHPRENPEIRRIEAAVAWIEARIGRARQANRRLEALRTTTRDPLVFFLAAAGARELLFADQALENAAMALELAPLWPAARRLFAEELLCRGRQADGLRVLFGLFEQGIEDADLALFAATLAFQLGAHETALRLFAENHRSWPAVKDHQVGFELADLPWRNLGTKALETGRLLEPRLATDVPGRRLVTMPILREHFRSNLATAFANAAGAQGLFLDCRNLEEIYAHGGGFARLAQVLFERHFRLVAVAARLEPLRMLLDQKVALIGLPQQRLFEHRKIELIAGYDLVKQTFLVYGAHQPWPRLVSLDELARRYPGESSGLIAVLTPMLAHQIAFSPESPAPTFGALLELERAIAAGDLGRCLRLEEATAEIDGLAAIRRDRLICDMTISAAEVARRLHERALDPKQSFEIRFAALLELALYEKIDAALIDDLRNALGGEQTLSPRELRLADRVLRMFWRSLQARFDEAAELAEEVLAEWPWLEVLWVERITALAALGRRQDLERVLTEALELFPTSFALRQQDELMRLSGPIAEQGETLRSLIESSPGVHRLKLSWLRLLLRQGDGLLFERAAREAQRYLPRCAAVYDLLSAWFGQQDRSDLALTIQDKRSEMIAESSPEPEGRSAWASAARSLGSALGNELAAIETSARATYLEDALPKVWAFPVVAGLEAFFAGLTFDLFDATAAERLKVWLEHQTRPHDKRSPQLDLIMARLESKCGAHVVAHRIFQSLTEAHPHEAEFWFHRALLFEMDGELEAALDAARHAAAAQPGHEEALIALLRIERHFGNSEGELVVLQSLMRLRPYSVLWLEEAAAAIEGNRGAAAALALVEEHRSNFRGRQVAGLRARLLVAVGNPKAAEEVLAASPEARRARPAQVRRAEVAIALARGHGNEALDLLESFLAESPIDLELIRLKVKLLESESGSAAARRALESGVLDVEIADLALGTKLAATVATTLLRTTQGDRLSLARLLARSLDRRGDRRELVAFLEACAQVAPQGLDLQAWRARLLISQGESQEAIALARQILAQDPESPRAIGLLADCLEAVNPREAREYLRREHEKTNSIESLAQMAGCDERLGDHQAAIAHFREVLRRAPDHPQALTHLFDLGEDPARLLDGYARLLARGRGFEVPGLHWRAVEIGIKCQRSLPGAWLEGARRRFKAISEADDESLAPERLHLGVAIAKWLKVHGREPEAALYRQGAGPLWQRLRLLDWPSGRRWITPIESAPTAEVEVGT